MSQPKQTIGKKLVYPPGVKDITEDISTDDLVRRLKECATAFQNMNQDDDNSAYIPLSLHLPVEYFMEHNSQEVRILTACCIADVFRVFAPDAPYKDPFQLKAIFEFFVNQLKGLDKPKEDNFKRYYFYLLENLSWVKTFNLCLELEDNQTILLNLFKNMFSIISDDHSPKLRSFILDMLTPLINEADIISQELLELILSQIIEPKKSQHKSACTLAKDLLKKTTTVLEPYIQAFFNNALILGKTENKELSSHLYDLIYELNSVSKSMLISVLPQLDFKLKSTDNKERVKATEVLSKLFSEKDSLLAQESQLLWQGFIGRFNDISAEVRVCVIRSSMDFLVNHPELREDITEQLRKRLHDNDENVRYEVVRTIINAGRKNFSCINNELLEFVKERTLDKKFKTRKEALLGLAMIYKEQEKTTLFGSPEMEGILWIRNKVLHLYYQQFLDDKLLVERILLTCLLPYQYPVEERMRKLYHLVSTVDDYAYRALKEVLRTQNVLRNNVRKLVEITSRASPSDKSLFQAKIPVISRELPDSAKAQEYILKFSKEMEANPKLRNTMFVILNGNVLSSEVEHNVKLALKSLGVASPTNPYYVTIKQLLERVAPIMIDKQGIQLLVQFINDTVLGSGNIENELGISNSCDRNLPFLHTLSMFFPTSFKQQEIFDDFLLFLQSDDEACISWTLQILMHICSDLEVRFPSIAKRLIPLLENFAETGTIKQAKSAIYCLNNLVSDKVIVFGHLLENLKKHFTLESQYFRTALVSIGYIAYLCSCLFSDHFKKIVSDVVVKNLLESDQELPRGGENDWGPLETLPEETKVKIAGMKFMIRWLLGLKHSVKACNSTLRLLNRFLINGGDLMERQHTAPQENSWLRLTAAVSIMKLCKESNYVDTLSVEQFQVLASVANDSCCEVRESFIAKLHKNLINMKLPLEFMAIFAFCGLETKKELKDAAKTYLSLNIRKRKDLGKHQPKQKLLSYLPDYVLPYAIYLLAHASFYEKYDDVASLHKVEDCLWFLMEHLVIKNENYSFSFLKRILEIMKQSKDRHNPDDQAINFKIYAITDLATSLLLTKTTNIVLQDFPVQPVLPSKLFTSPDRNNSNMKTYLPREILAPFAKTSKFDFSIFMEPDSPQKPEIEEPSQGNNESVEPVQIVRSRSSRRNKDASEKVMVDSHSKPSATNSTFSSVTKNDANDKHNHLDTINESCDENKESCNQSLEEVNHVSSKGDDELVDDNHSHLNSMETSKIVPQIHSESVMTIADEIDGVPGAFPSTRHKTLRHRSKRSVSDDIPLTTSTASKKIATTLQDSVPLNLLKDCNTSLNKKDVTLCENSLHSEKHTIDRNNSTEPQTKNSKKANTTRATRQKKNENISKEPPTANHRDHVSLNNNNKQNSVEPVAPKQLRSRAMKEASVPVVTESPKPVKRAKPDLKSSPPPKRVTRQTDGLLSVNRRSQTTIKKNTRAPPLKKKKT